MAVSDVVGYGGLITLAGSTSVHSVWALSLVGDYTFLYGKVPFFLQVRKI